MAALRTTIYEFGPYRLDPLGRSIERVGESISLPQKQSKFYWSWSNELAQWCRSKTYGIGLAQGLR